VRSIVNLNTLKNNTEETKSKCYASSRALLRQFFTSNFKNDDKYFAPPEVSPLSRLCWAGYGPDSNSVSFDKGGRKNVSSSILDLNQYLIVE